METIHIHALFTESGLDKKIISDLRKYLIYYISIILGDLFIGHFLCI
ncbi:hypothetical protein QEW_3751 [Clostridioides difficile CD160]|nr:hypothetical protein QEW_3751 [Clostridioides difficile CD160]